MNYYFVARIELNNHDEGDYEQLHKVLEGILFYRVIKGSDNKWYKLPTGEYVRHSDNTLDQIGDLIVTTMTAFIAKKPFNNRGHKKDYEFVLSRTENVRFKLKG